MSGRSANDTAKLVGPTPSDLTGREMSVDVRKFMTDGSGVGYTAAGSGASSFSVSGSGTSSSTSSCSLRSSGG
jgi:hypothetical protein